MLRDMRGPPEGFGEEGLGAGIDMSGREAGGVYQAEAGGESASGDSG